MWNTIFKSWREKNKNVIQKYAFFLIMAKRLRAYFPMSSLILCISQAIKNDSTPTLHYTFAPRGEALVFINLKSPCNWRNCQLEVFREDCGNDSLYKRTCLEDDPIARLLINNVRSSHILQSECTPRV